MERENILHNVQGISTVDNVRPVIRLDARFGLERIRFFAWRVVPEECSFVHVYTSPFLSCGALGGVATLFVEPVALDTLSNPLWRSRFPSVSCFVLRSCWTPCYSLTLAGRFGLEEVILLM